MDWIIGESTEHICITVAKLFIYILGNPSIFIHFLSCAYQVHTDHRFYEIINNWTQHILVVLSHSFMMLLNLNQNSSSYNCEALEHFLTWETLVYSIASICRSNKRSSSFRLSDKMPSSYRGFPVSCFSFDPSEFLNYFLEN